MSFFGYFIAWSNNEVLRNFVHQTNSSLSARENLTLSKWTGKQLSSSNLHSRTNSKSKSTEIGGLNTVDPFSEYLTASQQEWTNTTFKSLKLAQAIIINVAALQGHMNTAACTMVYQVPRNIKFYQGLASYNTSPLRCYSEASSLF